MAPAPSPSTPPPIRSASLRRALIAGVRRVIARRDALNRINVFPVPDGDTGSNLALTLGTVLSGALGRRAAGVGELLRRVGEHAVDGARGNSGAIVAQFFSGLSEAVGQRAALDAPGMAAALRSAAQSARAAMAQPREGTILSVITAFAEGGDPSLDSGNPKAWYVRAVDAARAALARTPEQLPALRKAGVVDAGAQGFVDLLEGIEQFLQGAGGGEVGADDDACADLEAAAVHADLSEADPQHRYCTECLLVGQDLDRARVHAALGQLDADCVVVAGGRHRVRVHAHVADPGAMFSALAAFGEVEGAKADDMMAQARSARRGGRVAVITDSSADLPAGMADALNLHVVPLRLSLGDRDHIDKLGMHAQTLYARLRQGDINVRTSQPAIGDFRRQFEFLLSHHPAVVYVGLSRAVSGTLQAGEAAAHRAHADRIHVWDSANAAGGLALLAMRAGELARDGADAQTILAALERLRPQTFTFAVAGDVSHIVRGGRVPRWLGWVARLLGAAPIARMKPDGRLHPINAVWGQSRIPEHFARYVASQMPESTGWRVIVGHCDAPARGEALLAALRAALPVTESWLVETGAAVGVHAGPDALVACLQPVDA